MSSSHYSLVVVSATILAAYVFIWSTCKLSKKPRAKTRLLNVPYNGILDMVGNTPLIRISSLSEYTKCDIYGKAEYTNPGGSSKDRIALSIILAAYDNKTLKRGGTVYEGTVGSTGISLALISRALGFNAYLVMPNDVSQDKVDMLLRIGAQVELVPPVSIIDPNHYVRKAQLKANADPLGIYVNQFENSMNFYTHLHTTGPELVEQTRSFQLDAFVMGAGTGGTISGIGHCLKNQPITRTKIVLADPQGSGLYNKVKHDVLYASTEQEGKRTRTQIDSVVEGIGLNRLSKNFEVGLPIIDDAIQVSDQEAVFMSRYILLRDGLFIGSSSAVNLVATVKYAKQLGPKHSLVTLLCDSGTRHLSKFWNNEYLKTRGLANEPANWNVFLDQLCD